MVNNPNVGDILGCEAFGPCSLEPHHPDLFWYGVHTAELLFTLMGPGCQTVSRTHTDDTDFVVGVWKDGRIGTFRGLRKGPYTYGAMVFGSKAITRSGDFSGYEPLTVEIAKFFRTGKPPVSAEITIELFAFMEAADESKRQGGKPVALEQVIDTARKAGAQALQSTDAGPWQAGLAETVITPEHPMVMGGYGSRTQPASGKLHDLKAKALVLEDTQGQRAVLVTMDLVGISRQFSVDVCQRIEKQFGVPRAAIALAVSHTHCGPANRPEISPPSWHSMPSSKNWSASTACGWPIDWCRWSARQSRISARHNCRPVRARPDSRPTVAIIPSPRFQNGEPKADWSDRLIMTCQC